MTDTETSLGREIVVLAARAPQAGDVLATVREIAPELLVRLAAGDSVFQFCATGDEAAYPVLSVDAPVLVPVAGEVARLLGDRAASVAPTPLWWIEIRAGHGPEESRLAARFAAALASRFGGEVCATAPGAGGLVR